MKSCVALSSFFSMVSAGFLLINPFVQNDQQLTFVVSNLNVFSTRNIFRQAGIYSIIYWLSNAKLYLCVMPLFRMST